MKSWEFSNNENNCHEDAYLYIAVKIIVILTWLFYNCRTLTEPVVDLVYHQRRVGLVLWHPTAQNVLLTAGECFSWFASISDGSGMNHTLCYTLRIPCASSNKWIYGIFWDMAACSLFSMVSIFWKNILLSSLVLEMKAYVPPKHWYALSRPHGVMTPSSINVQVQLQNKNKFHN